MQFKIFNSANKDVCLEILYLFQGTKQDFEQQTNPRFFIYISIDTI